MAVYVTIEQIKAANNAAGHHAECQNPHITDRTRSDMYRAMQDWARGPFDPMERIPDREYKLGRCAAYDYAGIIASAPKAPQTRYAVAFREGHGDPWNADPWLHELFTSQDEASAFVEQSLAGHDVRTAELILEDPDLWYAHVAIRRMTDDELGTQCDRFRSGMAQLLRDCQPTDRAVLMCAYQWFACVKEQGHRYARNQPIAEARRLIQHGRALGLDIEPTVNAYPELLAASVTTA